MARSRIPCQRRSLPSVSGGTVSSSMTPSITGMSSTREALWPRNWLAEGKPVMICWNDWGGHWQIIIGYDTMGTEYEGDDVIIVADSFDTTDHNQDGYGVYGAERFIYNFTFYDFFGDAPDHLRDKCFVAVKPAGT